jgi:hypothetical protein
MGFVPGTTTRDEGRTRMQQMPELVDAESIFTRIEASQF